MDPSIVRVHSVVPKPPANLTVLKVALSVWLDEEILVATAVLVSAARMTVAAIAAVMVRMGLMVTLLSGVATKRIIGNEMAPLVRDAISLDLGELILGS
jgi:hypothetical protein